MTTQPTARRSRRCAALLAALALFAGSAALSPAQEAKEEWIPLFNGKNLDGWTPKIKGYEAGVNQFDTFRVEDGVLKVAYDKYPKFNNTFGHLFYKDKFGHYILRVEYRFVGEQARGGPGWATRNSGVMFHCQSPQSMRKEQDFPVSVEAQFLGGLGKGERPTGSVCTPGTLIVMRDKLVPEHCTNSKSKTYHGDQWVTAEIEVHGSSKVAHRINGETVIEYGKIQLDPKDADAAKLIRGGKVLIEEGYIALQAESHPIEFRKVEIRILKK
jgi:hypothetical protein